MPDISMLVYLAEFYDVEFCQTDGGKDRQQKGDERQNVERANRNDGFGYRLVIG